MLSCFIRKTHTYTHTHMEVEVTNDLQYLPKEVVITNDTQFPLVLLGGEVLIFSGDVLKHVHSLESAYKYGFTSFQETKDFKLDYGLWRLVLSYLVEYEKTQKWDMSTNSWASVFTTIDLLRLYELLRIVNYYDIPLVMQLLMQIIATRLLEMPRFLLKVTHPLARIKSERDMLAEMRNPFEIINKQYTFKREEIKAVCAAYIKTHDIIEIIEKRYLPPISASICGSCEEVAGVLLLTSSGLKAKGDNVLGQLGTGIENKDWQEYDLSREDNYVFGDEDDDEAVAARLAQWERWREAKLAKPEWLNVPLPETAQIISVACGECHTMILTTNGLYGCGSNKEHQLSSSIDTRYVTVMKHEYPDEDPCYFLPTPLNAMNVLMVACGWFHTMIYTPQGLYACGENDLSQTGIGSAEEVYYVKDFTRLPIEEEVTALSLAGRCSFILTKGGHVYKAGAFAEDCAENLHYVPTETPIVSIAAGPYHVLLLNQYGDVYLQGFNRGLNPDADSSAYELIKIPGLPPIATIHVIDRHISLFVDAANVIYIQDGGDQEMTLPVVVRIPHKVISVMFHRRVVYFVTCDGLFTSPLTDELRTTGVGIFTLVDTIQLSDVPLCGVTIPQRQWQQRMYCHQCGEKNQASLSYHKEMRRVFCSLKPCLSEYREFRVHHQ